ncbi:hypothetical protein P4Y54_000068 [Acinetobacter baumannii]|nr:hypothetical protein [Acinetobacter baumannii]
MTDLNKERELFEEFFRKTFGAHRSQFSFDDYGFYDDRETLIAWTVWQEKAKAQAVPEDCVIVPKELHIEIAMKMAKERIFKQSAGSDQVWNELVEQAYKDNLQAEQYRLIRDYREMVKASESGAEQ